jgi:fucose permease
MIMVMLGFINNIRGTLVPSFRSFFGASYSQIGFMLMAASLGFMAATFYGGIAASRFGLKKVIACGFLLSAFSISLMGFIYQFIFLILLMSLLGVGLGFIEIGANSLGAKIFVKKSAMMMNMLHLFFGVGASIGPRYAGWLLNLNFNWYQIYYTALILIAFLMIYLLFSKFPSELENDKKDNIAIKDIITQKKVWFFAILLGSGVAVEVGIGSWLVNYLYVGRSFSAAAASSYLSLFFVVFTLGRLVGGYFTEHLGYIKILFYFSFGMIFLFSVGLFVSGSYGAIMFAMVGFFVSIIFPTTMAIIMYEFKRGVSSYMGFIITTASAINMLSNWLIGTITDFFGVFIGFASISIYMFIVLIFLYLLSKELEYDFAK